MLVFFNKKAKRKVQPSERTKSNITEYMRTEERGWKSKGGKTLLKSETSDET